MNFGWCLIKDIYCAKNVLKVETFIKMMYFNIRDAHS